MDIKNEGQTKTTPSERESGKGLRCPLFMPYQDVLRGLQDPHCSFMTQVGDTP